MALLFTFVLFGTSIIWGGVAAASFATIAFTIVSLLIRPIAFFPALIPARLSLKNRALIGWFGPRGLSTLLLVMLPVFKGIEGSDYLLQVSCLVVLVSVVLHGFSPMLLLRAPVAPKSASASPKAPSASLRSGLALREVPDDRPRASTITLDEYRALKSSERGVVLVDSRTDRTYDPSNPIPDSVRVHPDRAVADAIRHDLPAAATLVVFCA